MRKAKAARTREEVYAAGRALEGVDIRGAGAARKGLDRRMAGLKADYDLNRLVGPQGGDDGDTA